MLILTRRAGEAVMVGDDVKVVVLGAWGTQVRLGIEAPRAVSVHREEIYERVKREEGVRPPADHAATAAAQDVTEEAALLQKLRALTPKARAEAAGFIDSLLRHEGPTGPGAWDGDEGEKRI